MKLYNSVGPNPRVVRVFMAELGVSCDVEEIDILKGDNRQERISRGQSWCWVASISAR